MTRTRKIVLGLVAGLTVLIFALLLALPVIARGPVAKRVRAAVDDAVDARVEWGGVGITFFRSFPNLALRLDDLTVTGVGPFEGDTLAAIGSFRLVLSVPSVVRGLFGSGPIVVRSIEVHRPDLRLRVLEDGTANWAITKEQPASEAPEPEPEAGAPGRALAVSLRGLEIRDASIAFIDDRAGTRVRLQDFDQSLEGDFSRDAFVLRTEARAEETSVTFAGVPYLSRATVVLTAALDADMTQKRFTLRDNELRVNDLPLRFSGSVQVGEDRTDLDLTFGAPETDFRHLLSLVPAVYAHDFASLRTTGTMAVSGTVKGGIGKGAFPAFTLLATVSDGTFRYPDLPRGRAARSGGHVRRTGRAHAESRLRARRLTGGRSARRPYPCDRHP